MITPIRQPLVTHPSPNGGRSNTPRYLPLAIDVAQRRCLVVGGGRIGAGKALKLAGAGGDVTVLAPQISAPLREPLRRGQLRWQRGVYAAAALDDFLLVVAATADRGLNLRIGRDADARGILACVVSAARRSRVIFPAVHREGRITVAVHSDGRDCRLSQRVRDLIARQWPGPAGGVASTKPPARRGRPRAIRSGAGASAGTGTGKVYIVGAGPGAADLISLRGYRALQSADVVLADRLVPSSFLDQLGISTAGKIVEWLADDQPRRSQGQINQRLVFHARAGRTVARLKGGDPFVFGRGDAEIEHLSRHDVPWELIPGCSSATAVPAAAGLPLTRHGEGRSFAVATARVAGGGLPATFPRADSLAILMAVGVLDEVVRRLLADGWSPEAPAAVIERGTLPWERRVAGPLAGLDSLAADAGVRPPAVVVVGPAATAISAFQQRPTILFTGPDPTGFRALGNLLHWPAVAGRAGDEANRAHRELGRPLPEHEVIYFVSPAGVCAYWETYGPAAFERRVWCLGERARQALARYGVAAEVVRPGAPHGPTRDAPPRAASAGGRGLATIGPP